MVDIEGTFDPGLPPGRKRPKVKLTGENGNAFMIIGLCKRAAKAAGWSREEVDVLVADMFAAGSYDRLLTIAMNRFEVS